MHMQKLDETEKVSQTLSRGQVLTLQCYLHAYRLQPSNPLTHKAIPKLYQEQKNHDKLGRYLESRVQDSYNE